jgi:hypothetical protein
VTITGYNQSLYDAVFDPSNGQVIVSAVPEPGTFAMLLFGSVMLWAVGRKRG